ncbi:MAG: PEP-CTERM sorting domain-containing protein [Tepidisphaeraceae bacterium]
MTALPSYGALVTGPWNVATTNPPGGQGDGPITNANTASPTVGDNTSNSAAGEMIDSPFPAITLANTNDFISFTGSVTLAGTVNSAATSATPRTQFRFGLFGGDEAGLDDNGWVGYYMSNKHGNAGTPAGTLARKSVGNTTIYLSATGQTALTSVQGDGTASSLFHDATYAMTLLITRSGNDLIVSGQLTGSNGFLQSLNSTDTAAGTNGTYTFDHLGFLLGGNLGTDQAVFSNLTISTNVPEPISAAALGFVGVLVCLRRRRRA